MNNKQHKNNLRKIVNSVIAENKEKEFFDLSDAILLEQKKEQSFYDKAIDAIGSTAAKVAPAPDWMITTTDTVDGYLSPFFKGVGRVANSTKRELNKKIFYDSNNIKQAISRIKGEDENLEFIKQYFSMYGSVCYDNLSATEGQDYLREVFTDPGIYCLNPSIARVVRVWERVRKKEFISLYNRTNEYPNIEQKKEIRGNIFLKYLNNFRKVILKNSKDINESILIGTNPENWKDIVDFASLETNTAEMAFSALSMVFTPVHILNKKSQNFTGTVQREAKISENQGLSIESYLKFFRDRIVDEAWKLQNGEFKKSWYAFTVNMTYDPYGEKPFEHWKTKAFEQTGKYKGPKGGLLDLDSDTAASAGIMFSTSGASAAVVTKVINNLIKLTRIGKAAPHPGVKFGLVFAGIFATSLAVSFSGFYSNKDETEDEIENMIKQIKEIMQVYHFSYSTATDEQKTGWKIDYSEISKYEKSFFNSSKKIMKHLHGAMNTVAQWASETEYEDMAHKRKMVSLFSNLISLVSDSYSENNLSFKIPGYGSGVEIPFTKDGQDGPYSDKVTDLLAHQKSLEYLLKFLEGEELNQQQIDSMKFSSKASLKARGVDMKALGVAFGQAERIRYLRSSADFDTFLLGSPEEIKESNNFLLEDFKEILLEQAAQKISSSENKEKKIVELLKEWSPFMQKAFNIDILNAELTPENKNSASAMMTRARDLEDAMKRQVPFFNAQFEKLKDPSKNTESNIVDPVSNFNKWWRRTYQQDSKLGNLKDSIKDGYLDSEGNLKKELRYNILNLEYFKSLPGLKSTYSSSSTLDRIGQQDFLFMLIGPTFGYLNTYLGFIDTASAYEKFKELSEYELGSNGKSRRAKKNVSEIAPKEVLKQKNLFKNFTFDNVKDFNLLFTDTRKLFNSLPKNLSLYDAKPADDNPENVNRIYERFTILNSLIETSGIIMNYFYNFQKIINANFERSVDNVASSSAELSSAFFDRDWDQGKEKYSKLRNYGSVIITTYDYNVFLYRKIMDLFSSLGISNQIFKDTSLGELQRKR